MKRQHSCGAILFTVKNNKIYIILGKEYSNWFPFKGTCERDETLEETASREINEETRGILNIKPEYINLLCNFSTQRKHYHIALLYVDYSFVNQFYNVKNLNHSKYFEKSQIKLFSLSQIYKTKFHYVTYIPIRFYWIYLKKMQYFYDMENLYRQIQISKSLNLQDANYHRETYSDTRLETINYHSLNTSIVV